MKVRLLPTLILFAIQLPGMLCAQEPAGPDTPASSDPGKPKISLARNGTVMLRDLIDWPLANGASGYIARGDKLLYRTKDLEGKEPPKFDDPTPDAIMIMGWDAKGLSSASSAAVENGMAVFRTPILLDPAGHALLLKVKVEDLAALAKGEEVACEWGIAEVPTGRRSRRPIPAEAGAKEEPAGKPAPASGVKDGK